MCLPHLLRISNDTVEWLGVFMDNGFTCTESRLQLQRKTRSGKQSARPHDVADAPPSECVRERRVRGHKMCLPHLSWILKRPTIERMSSGSRGVVGLSAKAIGPRPALASLESVVGLSLKHAPTPVLRFKEKRTADTTSRTSITTVQSEKD